MKIVFICSNYLPFMGGVEIHAQQVSQHLSSYHDVSIAAMNFSSCRLPRSLGVLHGNLLAPSAPDSIDGRVQVHSLTPRLLERARMLPMALRVVPKIRRWFYHSVHRWTHRSYRSAMLPKLRRVIRGADVVHGLVHGDIGWAAEEAARLENSTYVCTPFVHPGQWGDGPEDVQYYKRCDAVIGLVESDRTYLESLGVDPHRLCTIGVSPDLPSEIDGAAFRTKYKIGDAPLILYVGRMMAAKGADAVVKAAGRVWERHPGARFVFIGPAAGNEAEIFEGVDARISYLGRVDLRDKANAIAACDIFVMPSMSEILPTVYLEAWSQRKVVIGGLAPGLKDLVEGNHAGINASQSPDEISAAIVKLLDDPETRRSLGQNGYDLVQRSYTVGSVAGALEKLYLKVCGKE